MEWVYEFKVGRGCCRQGGGGCKQAQQLEGVGVRRQSRDSKYKVVAPTQDLIRAPADARGGKGLRRQY